MKVESPKSSNFNTALRVSPLVSLKNFIKYNIDNNNDFIKKEELVLCIIRTMIIIDIFNSERSPSEDIMKSISHLVLEYFTEYNTEYKSDLYNLIYEIILKCNCIDDTSIIKDKLNELLK